ncbi:MAG: hypothetical protein ABI411_14825 [Tahibacter sp.]
MLILASACVPFGDAYAGSGDLDPVFGSGGITIVDFTPLSTAPGTVGSPSTDLDPRGRTWGAATVVGVGTRGLGLTRLTRDGQLDPTFGTLGIRYTASDQPASFQFDALRVDRDGHAYVTYEDGDPTVWHVCRLAEDGSIDVSYFDAGCAAVPMPITNFRALVVNPVDGNVWLLGSAAHTGSLLLEPAVVEIDTATHSVRSARIPVAGANVDIRAATFSSTGVLFVTGAYATIGANRDAFAGSITRAGNGFSFQLLGSVSYNVGATLADVGRCIALTASDKVQIGVAIEAGGGAIEWGSARFSAPDTLDPGYGIGGKTAEVIASSQYAVSNDESAIAGCVAQRDGGFTLAGNHRFADPAAADQPGAAFALHRLRSDGTADQSFGGDLALPGVGYSLAFAGTAIDYLRSAASAKPRRDIALSISKVPHSGAVIVSGVSLRPGSLSNPQDLVIVRVLGDEIFDATQE